ncbi:hypothetical protein CPC08DRAFT_756416 [Agrocybe pediades]|nr:hypothetical protein CPC08DRAFT_756416 [Agrocybe pediades]
MEVQTLELTPSSTFCANTTIVQPRLHSHPTPTGPVEAKERAPRFRSARRRERDNLRGSSKSDDWDGRGTYFFADYLDERCGCCGAKGMVATAGAILALALESVEYIDEVDDGAGNEAPSSKEALCSAFGLCVYATYRFQTHIGGPDANVNVPRDTFYLPQKAATFSSTGAGVKEPKQRSLMDTTAPSGRNSIKLHGLLGSEEVHVVLAESISVEEDS